MIKLTLQDGSPLYVNPAHVVSVMAHPVPHDSPPRSDIRLRDDEASWIVRGAPRDVVTLINGGAQ